MAHSLLHTRTPGNPCQQGCLFINKDSNSIQTWLIPYFILAHQAILVSRVTPSISITASPGRRRAILASFRVTLRFTAFPGKKAILISGILTRFTAFPGRRRAILAGFRVTLRFTAFPGRKAILASGVLTLRFGITAKSLG